MQKNTVKGLFVAALLVAAISRLTFIQMGLGDESDAPGQGIIVMAVFMPLNFLALYFGAITWRRAFEGERFRGLWLLVGALLIDWRLILLGTQFLLGRFGLYL
jgi:hypothetical protein